MVEYCRFPEVTYPYMVIIFKVERPPAGKYLKRSALSAAIRIIGKFVVKLTSLLNSAFSDLGE